MSIWTWKQAVAEQILEIVNSRRDIRFDIHDVYGRQHVLHDLFPRNRHVRQKMRQMLQRLRDAGFIEFLGDGKYQLVAAYGELDWEPAQPGETAIEVPSIRTVVRRVRLRNTFLAAQIKRRDRDTCQVCRERLQLVNCTYAESHHIKPMGTPHNGPDVEGNILVVCLNHHVMFDRGALIIDPSSFVVSHVSNAMDPRPLLLHSWHRLNRRYLEYHATIVSGGA
jgi:predicted restriction endonuclease